VSASGARSARGASSSLGAPSAEVLRQDLVAGQQQIDRTLSSLRRLTDPTTEDLRAAYDDYSNQLARMTDHADKAGREANAMRKDRNAYFAQWENKVTEIDNPTIRASAAGPVAAERVAADGRAEEGDRQRHDGEGEAGRDHRGAGRDRRRRAVAARMRVCEKKRTEGPFRVPGPLRATSRWWSARTAPD
jgi:hypothetical protein